MWQLIAFGCTLGFISSLHCVGMCGPLALALPIYNTTGLERLSSLLLYNFGRITTYILLGLLAGLFSHALSFAGLQQSFSIITGMLIFTITVAQLTGTFRIALQNRWLRTTISQLLSSKGNGALMLLGIANGFLPCGMVYIAVSGAVASESIGGSILVMLGFGLATVPAMLAVSEIGFRLNPRVRKHFRKIMPLAGIIVGGFLILRGFNITLMDAGYYVARLPARAISCLH